MWRRVRALCEGGRRAHSVGVPPLVWVLLTQCVGGDVTMLLLLLPPPPRPGVTRVTAGGGGGGGGSCETDEV